MKVIYMSGYTDDAIIHHGIVEEGIPFIQKSFSSRDIVCKASEMLDSKKI